jgi:hypothetical protein
LQLSVTKVRKPRFASAALTYLKETIQAMHTVPAQDHGGKADCGLCDHALSYAARGWSIIPTTEKKAASFWEPFQNAAADDKTLRRLFSKKGVTGLAVIFGPVSGGLACRDFDQANAYTTWASTHADLAATLPTVETSRGQHVYFRGPERFVKLGDGEYRGTSGQYCLLPPSLHPRGKVYQWTVPLPDGDLPFVDPEAAGFFSDESSNTPILLPPTQTHCMRLSV